MRIAHRPCGPTPLRSPLTFNESPKPPFSLHKSPGTPGHRRPKENCQWGRNPGQLLMRFGSFVCAALLTICIAHASHDSQEQKPETLLNYIESLHWDENAKGPLLAIEPGHVVRSPTIEGEETQPRTGLFALDKRLVKVGGVWVFAPTTRAADPNVDSKTLVDYLDSRLKIAALLANLSDSEFERLNQIGLCADELTGDERAALLAEIPEQTDLYETYSDKDGQLTTGEPWILNPADRTKIKFQICRGADISLLHKTGENQYEGGPTFTSLDGPRLPGVHPLHSQALELGLEPSPFSQEKQVEAIEKKYNFEWNNTRLSKTLQLKTDEPIGDLIGRINDLTKIEIYADARIAQFRIHSIGAFADCASLLHALAVATDGVIRPIGPAFILTKNLEGDATASARVAGQEFVAQRQVEQLVTEWVRDINARGFYKRIAFLADDQLADALFPSGYVRKTSDPVTDVRPLGACPQLLQTRARKEIAEEAADESGSVRPYDHVSIENAVLTRWIFPDGRTIKGQPLSSIAGVDTGEQTGKSHHSPLDVSKLAEGSGIEIMPPDASSASKMVTTLISYGFKEVWVDSTDPSVIEAATRAGDGHVDLVIRPWRAVKGEAIANPDLDVLGLTGSQVANLPQGKLNRTFDFHIFEDTFLPSDPNLKQHWSKVLSLIPKFGVKRLIVLDPEVGGYAPPPRNEVYGGTMTSFEGNQFSFGSLMQQDPSVNDFGYTLQARLRFLREHDVDPVDLEHREMRSTGTVDEPDFLMGSLFDDDRGTNKYLALWKTERRQLASEALSALTDQLQSLPYEVCVQLPFKENYQNPEPTGPQVMVNVNGKKVQVDWVPVGPAYSEDANGNLTGALDLDEITNGRGCIDFRVPPKDFDRYVKHFFALPKPAPPGAPKLGTAKA
jgi:hypothetical protein